MFYQPEDWGEMALLAGAEQQLAHLATESEYTEQQLAEVLGKTMIEFMQRQVEHPVTRIRQGSE